MKLCDHSVGELRLQLPFALVPLRVPVDLAQPYHRGNRSNYNKEPDGAVVEQQLQKRDKLMYNVEQFSHCVAFGLVSRSVTSDEIVPELCGKQSL
jgi:hypothetical protein